MHQNAIRKEYLTELSEGQYLMEQTIANNIAPLFVNEFNRVMGAYKKGDTKIPTYTAKYEKTDDYKGKISIYADGKLQLTSLKDFGVAVTAPFQQELKMNMEQIFVY